MSRAHTKKLYDFNVRRYLAHILGWRRTSWLTRDNVVIQWKRRALPMERLLEVIKREQEKPSPITPQTIDGSTLGEGWVEPGPATFAMIDFAAGDDTTALQFVQFNEAGHISAVSMEPRRPPMAHFIAALTLFHIENGKRMIEPDEVERTKRCWLLTNKQRDELIEKVSFNLINEFRHIEGI